MNKENKNCFAVAIGDIALGIDLPIEKAQKLSKKAIKKFGLNMVAIVNQNFIDIKKLISM